MNFLPNLTMNPLNLFRQNLRYLNKNLDQVFYDIQALSKEEQKYLSSYPYPEGSILIVYPQKSNQKIYNLSLQDFIHSQLDSNSTKIDTIAIAGVGSSDLGTAALARNIANYLNKPVAGIISGFGMSDMLTEALGGWFVLGATNTFRYNWAKWMDEKTVMDLPEDDLNKIQELSELSDSNFIEGSPDSTTLLQILIKLGSQINLLVGHSKGNYIIENALQGLIVFAKKHNLTLPSSMKIITLGAVIYFPPEFTNVKQVIGSLDFFGMLNSRPTLDATWIYGCGHSLNSVLPGSISVAKAFKKVGV